MQVQVARVPKVLARTMMHVAWTRSSGRRTTRPPLEAAGIAAQFAPTRHHCIVCLDAASQRLFGTLPAVKLWQMLVPHESDSAHL
jgi:hypothetical protein